VFSDALVDAQPLDDCGATPISTAKADGGRSLEVYREIASP
jgi:hypothetical protein